MKKFFSTLCIICLLVLSLAGCSLVETNMARYLSQPVAKAGGVTVTMEDLVEGLNAFGYEQYANTEQNKTGNTQEQVVEKTISDLLDREFILQYIETNNEVTLTTYEEKKAKKNAYNYINNTLKSYEDEIRVEWDIVPPTKDAEAVDEEAKKNLYTPYTKKVAKKVNTNVLEYIDTTIPEKLQPDYDEIMALGEFAFLSAGAPDNVNAGDDDKKVFIEAQSRLYRTLRKNNKDRGGKEKTDDVLVADEIKRMYDKSIDNAKITKLGQVYQSNMEKNEISISTLKKTVATTFKLAYNKERNDYNVNADGVIPQAKLDEYYKKVKESKEPILFHPQENKFFYVSHILVGYSDTAKAELEAYKKLVDAGKYTNEDLKAFKANQALQIKGQARNSTTGKLEGEFFSVEEIRRQAELAVSGEATPSVKAKNFIDVMHKFSTDPGTLNAVQNYTIPLDKAQDQMVPEFADASRALREKALKQKTNFLLSDPVLTENGYHIIVYVGEVENEFASLKDLEPENNTNIDSIVNTLYDKQIKIGHNKTYFDYFVEKAKAIDQNNYMDSIVKAKRDNLKISLYKGNYKKLIKG